MVEMCDTIDRDDLLNRAKFYYLNFDSQQQTKAQKTSIAAVEQLKCFWMESFKNADDDIDFIYPVLRSRIGDKVTSGPGPLLELTYIVDEEHALGAEPMWKQLQAFFGSIAIYPDASDEWWQEHTQHAITQVLRVKATGAIVAAQTSLLMYTRHGGGRDPMLYVFALGQDDELATVVNASTIDEKVSAFMSSDLIRILLSMLTRGAIGGILTQSVGWEFLVNSRTKEVRRKASGNKVYKPGRHYWSKHLHPPSEVNPAAIHFAAQLSVLPNFVDPDCLFFHKFYKRV